MSDLMCNSRVPSGKNNLKEQKRIDYSERYFDTTNIS